MILQSGYINDTRETDSTPHRSIWKTLWRVLFLAMRTFIVASVILVIAFRWLPVPTSAFMVYRHFQDVSQLQTFKPIRYDWVSYTEISPHPISIGR